MIGGFSPGLVFGPWRGTSGGSDGLGGVIGPDLVALEPGSEAEALIGVLLVAGGLLTDGLLGPMPPAELVQALSATAASPSTAATRVGTLRSPAPRFRRTG
ncbi:MAG: hypothetical protein M3070_06785 [Actinomycetota bacterium]|nr:hypothetical protein [Actinomycetota bacterium]